MGKAEVKQAVGLILKIKKYDEVYSFSAFVARREKVIKRAKELDLIEEPPEDELPPTPFYEAEDTD